MILMNYKSVAGHKLLLCLVFFIVNLVLDYTVMTVYIKTFSSTYSDLIQNPTIYIMSAFTSKIILLVSAFFFKKLRKQKTSHSYNTISSFTISLLIVPILSVFNMIFLVESTMKYDEISAWFFADAIGLLLCNIFIVFLWDKFDEYTRVRVENALLKQEIKNNMDNALAYENLYKKQRGLSHDFQNHFLAIQGLLENDKLDQALTYVSEWTKRKLPIRQMVSTNNHMIDVVLNQKYEEACSRDVKMSFLFRILRMCFSYGSISTTYAAPFYIIKSNCYRFNNKCLHFRSIAAQSITRN